MKEITKILITCVGYSLIFTINVNAQNGSLAKEHLQLADNFKKDAKPDSALLHYKKAAMIFEALDSTEQIINSNNQIGIILTRQDKYEEAKTYLNKALSKATSLRDTDNLFIATTHISFGVVHSAEGNYDLSLIHHNKALGARLRKLGENHADVATSYGNIGNVYYRSKDYDRAIDAHLKAMKIRETLFGSKSTEVTQSYTNLGNAYKELKDYEMSLQYYIKALDSKIAQKGPKHKDLLSHYQNVSEVLYLMGDKKHGDLFKASAAEISNN